MSKLLTFAFLWWISKQANGENTRMFHGAVLVRWNYIFRGKLLRTVREPSIPECAHACLRRKACVSLTYCQLSPEQRVQICHLHIEGAQEKDDNRLLPRNGCVFQQFRVIMDCSEQLHCENGGTCHYNYTLGQLACSCTPPYSGQHCEQAQGGDYFFHNLGAEGGQKPSSTVDYKGTSLEGRVTLNSGIQFWTVPVTGMYLMIVAGAEGARGAITNGGKGAYLTGKMNLQKGDQLKVLVGQQGLPGMTSSSGGGGGGGTFVLGLFNNGLITRLLAVAGGGGGGGGLLTQSPGEGGQTSPNGSVNGGVRGFGGTVCSKVSGVYAGGGGGYTTNGSCAKYPNCIPIHCIQGGRSFQEGGGGGIGHGAGGFGGGGAAFGSFPGGGGGYSGGGVNINANLGSAGGGGSILRDGWRGYSNQNQNHGFVRIKFV